MGVVTYPALIMSITYGNFVTKQGHYRLFWLEQQKVPDPHGRCRGSPCETPRAHLQFVIWLYIEL